MPDGTNNIYLDSTFTSVDEGYEVVDNSVEFVDPVDNIGNYNIPAVYQTTTPVTTETGFIVEYFTNYTTISGIDNVPLSFFRELLSKFGVIPSLVDYNIGDVVSGTQNNYIIYSTGYNTVSGVRDEKLTYIAGEHYTNFKNYLVEHRRDPIISGSNGYWQVYMNYSGNTSVEGLPIPSISGYGFSIVGYETKGTGFGQLPADVDITFAGWVNFPFSTDIYSVDAGITDGYSLDVLTISGGVIPHYLDIYSSLLTTSGIDFDVYCSLMDMAIIDADIELTSGRTGYVRCEIYSTAVSVPVVFCDIDLYPLKITNFSLDIGEYTTASGNIFVDVLDDVYGVTISGTYFKVDGEIVPVTFSGIEDGYRMFYDPVDGFSSLDGSTIFTAHAENSNGNVLEEDFYLTFGYIVEYDNKPRIDVGFDYNTKVTVRVTAENYDTCPETTADGHRFITEHRENIDLSASIVGMFHAEDTSDLPVKIYPQSTAYYYGKEFTVIIEAKDFAGNVMPSVVLQYRIEDKPS